MSEKQSCSTQQALPHLYTEEERRLRWALIIEAIQHNPTSTHPLEHPVNPPASSEQKA